MPNIAVSVTLKPPLAELVDRYNLTEKQVAQIGTSAINRSLTTVRSRVTKRLADAINLRQADIRKSIAIKKANYTTLSGSVVVSRKPVPLRDFIGTRQTKAGVSVQVRKSGPREILKSTFIATMASGHEGVFERQRLAGKKSATGPRFGRLPIIERFGLTLTGYLSNAPAAIAEEQAAAGEVLSKNVMSQLMRRLAERGATFQVAAE